MQKTKNSQNKNKEQSERTHTSCLADLTNYINCLAVSHKKTLRLTFFKPRANGYTTKHLILLKQDVFS